MIFEQYTNSLLLDLYSFLSEDDFLDSGAKVLLRELLNSLLKNSPSELNTKVLLKENLLKINAEDQQIFFIYLQKTKNLLKTLKVKRKDKERLSKFIKNLEELEVNMFSKPSYLTLDPAAKTNLPNKDLRPSTINKFPNEILNLIFSNLKTLSHSSNQMLLNLALVKKRWSTVALPLIYNKLYTNHDNLVTLHKLVKGLNLNKEYLEKDKFWFKPNIFSIEFFSKFKNTSQQYKAFNKELILEIIKFSKNLRQLAFVVNEKERVEFTLQDLSFIFKHCSNLVSLDISGIKINHGEEEETITAVKNGFSKLKTVRVFGLNEGELVYIFKLFEDNLRNLELEEVTPELSKVLVGKLKNLTVLNLTKSDAPFHMEAVNNLFKSCPNLKSFYTFRLTNVILNALVDNHIRLKKIQGWLDGRGEDDLFHVDFETVSRFFNNSNLTEINFGLIKFNLFSGKNNLKLLSENLSNLNQLSIFANYNQNISPECLFKCVASTDFKSFLSDFKNFLVNVRKLKTFLFKFEEEIEGNEDELKEIKKLLDEFKIKYE
ncbi:hypothetical protein HDU92_003498 [Lobulomyces angularis]|nr:hypothetical protein HDU92_003498 [Lobulomyces angularis]